MPSLTPAELKSAGIPGLTGTGEDSRLTAMIARVDALIATWLGYPPATVGAVASFETTTYTEYYDGPDLEDASIIRLGLWPVQSITNIHDDADRVYGSTTLVSSSDYELDGREGYGMVIGLPTGSHSTWTTALRALKVVMVGGYATVPDWLKDAALIQCQHRLKLRAAGPVQSATRGGASIQLREDDGLLEEVRGILWPHRLPRAIL